VTAAAIDIGWRVVEVASVVTENPRVKTLVFDAPGWEGHLPGQHVDIRLTAEDGYQAVRSYSISSAPERGRLAVTVERLGDGEVSPYLVDEVIVGDSLELRGPIGGYFAWQPALGGPLLLIAGGSGIAPLMAMIRLRAVAASDVPVRLLYSARGPQEVIFGDDLERLAAASVVDVVYTFTRTQPPGWPGHRRRIDEAMLREVAWAPDERPLIYVCGPTRLVESVAETLVAIGHAPERVKTERFGPTG
jgi:ferredoxin-NADP reductase